MLYFCNYSNIFTVIIVAQIYADYNVDYIWWLQWLYFVKQCFCKFRFSNCYRCLLVNYWHPSVFLNISLSVFLLLMSKIFWRFQVYLILKNQALVSQLIKLITSEKCENYLCFAYDSLEIKWWWLLVNTIDVSLKNCFSL